MEELTSPGMYRTSGKGISGAYDYTILVSGKVPFLKIEVVWDNHTNKIGNTDVFRGKGNLNNWEKI